MIHAMDAPDSSVACCVLVSAAMVLLPVMDAAGDPARDRGESRPAAVKVDGYKGIWFPLGQRSEFGDKYSGGLGTYTAKHVPLAVYAPAVNKTFFVYGGTPAAGERRLLVMASEYDHASHTVPRPTVVLDKSAVEGRRVDDPHDNPALAIDEQGFLWVFVAGRGRVRQDHTFRSTRPYSVEGFEAVEPPGGDKRAYPQVFHLPGSGFMHFFTLYQPGRELFFRTSADGVGWSPNVQLADMEGHYQVSWRCGNKFGLMFNRHPGRVVDRRTDLFYMQTTDFGASWTTADGTPLTLPLVDRDTPARVFDGVAADKLVYLNDLNFDQDGNPVLFFTTASNAGRKAHQPGPAAEPRRWVICHWDGGQWTTREMPPSATAVSTVTHNYDTGCIHIEGGLWRVIGPSGAPSVDAGENPERFWGQGGEMEVWESRDQGASWSKLRALTSGSARNHGYARRTLNASDRFATFWADGNPDGITESHLYFGNKDGSLCWELPFAMTSESAAPVEAGSRGPADNPVTDRYPESPEAVPEWVRALPWTRVVNIRDFPASGNSFDDALVAAQAALAKQGGGGVVRFPPGSYRFDRDIVLEDGVILQGAKPVGGLRAVDDSYSLPTRLEFPKYKPSMLGAGTPIDTAFRSIRTADPGRTSRCGLVHLAINRAHVYFEEEKDHKTAGKRLVFGCILTNTAAADPSIPNNEYRQAPHQRFTHRHRAAIHVYCGEDLFIANNRIPPSADDNFAVKPYHMVKVHGNGQDFRLDSGKKFDFITVEEGVEFDYDNRPGIYANLFGIGAVGNRQPKGTPESHPYGFRKGTIIRDNFIYCSGRSAITFTGDGVYCAFNKIRFPQNVRRPTTTGLVASDGSATNDNRAITMRGYRWHVHANDYEVHSNLAFDGKTKINDGEGIMHESHHNSMVKDAKLTDNVGNRYLCFWVAPIDGLVVRGNKITADRAAIHVLGRECAIRNVRIEDNELTRGNIAVSAGEAENIRVTGNRHTGEGVATLTVDDPVWAKGNAGFQVEKPGPKKRK